MHLKSVPIYPIIQYNTVVQKSSTNGLVELSIRSPPWSRSVVSRIPPIAQPPPCAALPADDKTWSCPLASNMAGWEMPMVQWSFLAKNHSIYGSKCRIFLARHVGWNWRVRLITLENRGKTVGKTPNYPGFMDVLCSLCILKKATCGCEDKSKCLVIEPLPQKKLEKMGFIVTLLRMIYIYIYTYICIYIYIYIMYIYIYT